MFSHITVPVDGSRFAESAIPYATTIARRADGKVELVIVEEEGLPPRVIERIDGVGTDVIAGARERSAAATYVIELAVAVHRRSGVPVAAAALAGRPADALVDHIDTIGTSLVVMTTHGRGAFSRFWLGSVADEMSRTTTAPLLLVRPPEEQDAPLPDEVAIREILVPLDGSPHGEEVLTVVAPLAAALGARITLLRVAEIHLLVASPFAPDLIQIDDVGLEAQRAQGEKYLAEIAARLRHRGFNVDTAVVEGLAAADIIAYADSTDADLIAMSTHGYGGLKRMLLGSVADKCLRQTHRPILLLRPTGGD